MPLLYVLIFSLLGSVGALTGAGALVAFPWLHNRLKTILLAYAVGTLLGATFIGLLPEAMAEETPRRVGLFVLTGILFFFLLEKFLRLPHAHGHAGEINKHQGEHHGPHPAGTMILIGDAFHNFVDGVVIATAFSVSVSLGIVTSLAVIAHEVPQELGDFVILIESGWHRWTAYWANFVSSLATFAGALVAYFALESIAPRIPFFLTLSAASFLYIGMVDLAPILHHDSGLKKSLVQLMGLLAGVGTILLLHQTLQ
ncbi:MAG TPA: ZIP family metal transporter [Pyrinomonadaceae bacterium]|nr:ZIP family metal transporter [Pyrinomonadaceae bacterium]